LKSGRRPPPSPSKMYDTLPTTWGRMGAGKHLCFERCGDLRRRLPGPVQARHRRSWPICGAVASRVAIPRDDASSLAAIHSHSRLGLVLRRLAFHDGDQFPIAARGAGSCCALLAVQPFPEFLVRLAPPSALRKFSSNTRASALPALRGPFKPLRDGPGPAPMVRCSDAR